MGKTTYRTYNNYETEQSKQKLRINTLVIYSSHLLIISAVFRETVFLTINITTQNAYFRDLLEHCRTVVSHSKSVFLFFELVSEL